MSDKFKKKPSPSFWGDVAEAFGVIVLGSLLIYFIYGLTTTAQRASYASEDPACAELDNWLEKHGGGFKNVRCKLMEESGGRGLIVTGPIHYKETYITVPMKLWFHEKTIKQSSDLRKMIEKDPVIVKTCGKNWGGKGEPCRLILALAYEFTKGKDSFWWPYIQTFPETPTSPVWWDEETLDGLEAPHVKNEIQSLQAWTRQTYGLFFPYLTKKYPKLFSGKLWSEKLFTATALHVWGRAFDTMAQDPRNKKRHTWGMIPAADLVNHESYVESFYGDNKGMGPFSCWATEALDTGAQIFQSYGSHRSSTHFFIYYGFVPTGYFRSDYISFQMDEEVYEKYNPGGDGKKGNAWPSTSGLTGFAGVDGAITEVAIAQHTKFYRMAGLIPEGTKEDAAYKFTLQMLLDATEKQYRGFATTYEEDFAELTAGFDGYDKWAQLTFRSRYKHVYAQVIENLKYRVAQPNPTKESAWKFEQIDWLLNYDESEVSQDEAHKSAMDGMNIVNIKPGK